MAEREVKVKIGADTSGLNRGLNSATGMLGRFGGAAGIAKAAGAAFGVSLVATGAAMVALTRRSLEQIDAQAKLAQSLGTTVSSMQTLKRAGELAGVSMGGIQQATGDLTRRLSQAASGVGPVAAALDRLNLSAAALSEVPLDQRILQINEALDRFVPATERAAVAGQLFGEEGSLAMARIDTATLRQATEDVHRFGVVVSEQDAEQIEVANDAVTRLGLVMEGLGNRLATSVAPAIEATANGLVAFAGNVLGIRVELEQFFGTLEAARAMLGEELFARMLGDPALIRDQATALDAIVVEMESLATVAATAVPQLRIFADELDDLGEEKAATAMRAFADEIVKANADLAAKIITVDEFNAKIADIAVRSRAVVTEFERINGANFSNAFANISTLTQRLWDAASAASAARANIEAAIFSQSSAGQALAQYGGRGTTSDRPIEIANPSALAPGASPRPGQRGVDSATFGTSGGGAATGSGAGAGIQDMFAQRLEALQEGLQTEAEVIAEWYAEGQETLQTALDQKMLTEQEYHDLRERLEQEHQERLGRIREMGNQWGVQAALSGGAEILNAVGQTNKKALRMAKIFSAAQALISTYEGAAKELRKGTFGFASAAAVIAKGIGFVNAIRSVNDSGGGGGGTGGGGSTGSAGGQQAQQPMTTFQFTLTNDPFGFGESFARQFIDQLNQTARNGGQIRGVIA
jgi:hypothetical protein